MLPKTLLNYMESFEFEMQETLVEFKKNPKFWCFFFYFNAQYRFQTLTSAYNREKSKKKS